MLYYKFKNYEEFKTTFGIQKLDNGVKNRKNKILLAYIKDKKLLHEAVVNGDYSLLHISSLVELKRSILSDIILEGKADKKLKYTLSINGRQFYSAKYGTDEYNGLCEDNDYRAIRYINHESNRVYKMKAGKLFRSIILETEIGQSLPTQVVTFLQEELSQEWQSYALGALPENTLYVDQDFKKIYDSSECLGNFNSCMTNRGLHSFYEDAVDASAAYLENEEGLIIARCILFNKVYDEDGKEWRLAERQYSTDGNLLAQRLLIDALIKDNIIDGYKTIGAGCSDSSSFVDCNGESLSDKNFYIDCNLYTEDTLSYQDSFKWYDMDQRRAYNKDSDSCCYMLDITDGQLEEDEYQEYDSYHEEYCYETVNVYVQGEEKTCNIDRLYDFINIDDTWYHCDDIEDCPYCDDRFVTTDGYYSELLDETYCCLSCNEEAEEEARLEAEESNHDNDENVA